MATDDFKPKTMIDLENITYNKNEWTKKRKYQSYKHSLLSDSYEEVLLKEFENSGLILNNVRDKTARNPERTIVAPFSGAIEIKTLFGDDVEILKNENQIELLQNNEFQKKTLEKLQEATQQLEKYEYKIACIVYGPLLGLAHCFTQYSDSKLIYTVIDNFNFDAIVLCVAPISLNNQDSWKLYAPIMYIKNKALEKYFKNSRFVIR